MSDRKYIGITIGPILQTLEEKPVHRRHYGLPVAIFQI